MISLLNTKKFQAVFFAGVFIFFLLLAAYTGELAVIAIPFALILFYSGFQQINLVFYLLLFSLPVSFEYHFSDSIGTDVPAELLMLFVSGAFVCYWIIFSRAIPKARWQHPLILFLFFSFAWAIIAVAFSTQSIVSIKYLLAKSWYIGAFVIAPLIVFRQKQNLKYAALVIASSMFLVIIIALIRHWGMGFRFIEINEAIAPFFRNHVTYAAMLVCTIPLFFAFYKLSKPRKWRVLISIAVLIMLVALFLSYSRGAWLALVAGLVTYRLIRKKILLTTYILGIIGLLGLLFWIKSDDNYLRFANNYNKTIYHADFRQHLVATYKLKDISTAERFYRWIAGVRMIKDNSLTGYGPNTFYDQYKTYAIPAFRTWVSNNPDHSTVHNYFLLLATEQGIPGLIFFLALLGGMLYYAQQLYHRIRDVYYKTIAITIGAILAMIITVNFLSDLIETDKIGSIFFLCLSILIVTDINTRHEFSNKEID